MRKSYFAAKHLPVESGRAVIERGVNADHARKNARLRSVIMGGNFFFNNLTDDDGKQQFVYGYTPMSADYRVGHA